MTYSLDFRSKVLKIRKTEDLSMAEVAKRFGVGLASVMRWSKNLEAKTKRNKLPTWIDMEALKRDVEEYPDAYLKKDYMWVTIVSGTPSNVWMSPIKKAFCIPKQIKKNVLCFANRSRNSEQIIGHWSIWMDRDLRSPCLALMDMLSRVSAVLVNMIGELRVAPILSERF